MKDKNYVPMKFKELAVVLNVKKEDRHELDLILQELINDGLISLSKRGKYSIPKKEYIKGTFIGNEKGFGFVEVEGLEEDFFISEKNTNNAFHGDTVLISVEEKSTGRRREGKVERILSHEIKAVVGYFQDNRTFGYVLPDNLKISSDIYISKKNINKAKHGDKVVCRITDYGSEGKKPEGKIIKILGNVKDPGVDILSIINAYDIPNEFSEEVIKYVNQIPDEVSEKDIKGRLDLRSEQTVTIDGEDAKDLDDAVTLKKEDDRYILGVHIADVSHYVKEGSVLDDEALKRATSVYLIDRVIPMLPKKLSNGICSLNEGVDRLALSCIMKINSKGEIEEYDVRETVINVDRRMTYTEVNSVINDDEEAINRNRDFVDMFNLMYEVSHILRKKRNNRGAVNFDTSECTIELDEKGKPVSIKPYIRNRATKIIEDFMLAANETIAESFYWQEVPFLYRIHEDPDPEKMKTLSMFAKNFGYNLRTSNGKLHPKELQKLLSEIEGKDEEPIISRMMLRSMQRAIYTPENKGHYGLSAQYYCHFTSPIRRYPDLQIHRIIKQCINAEMNDKKISYYKGILEDVAKECSIKERRADDAERECEKMKKAEYMKDHLGETFTGIISGVTNYGVYVELENTIEGLVHISEFRDDYYIYNEDDMSLISEKTGKAYKLGQKINIRVDSASKVSRTIDFSLA